MYALAYEHAKQRKLQKQFANYLESQAKSNRNKCTQLSQSQAVNICHDDIMQVDIVRDESNILPSCTEVAKSMTYLNTMIGYSKKKRSGDIDPEEFESLKRSKMLAEDLFTNENDCFNNVNGSL